MNRILLTIAMTASLMLGHGVAADASEPGAACAGCHRGTLGFEGSDADELAQAIAAIRDGEKPHPPLSLSDDSDESIRALADALVSKKDPIDEP